MVELIIFRHPETMGDMVYVKHGTTFIPYARGKRFLKGQSDDVLYRLSHKGVLAAHMTAHRIIEFYRPPNKAIKRVDLWRNKSIRSSEGEEITRVTLKGYSKGPVKEIKVIESDDLLERCFGSIEGQDISRLEYSLEKAKTLEKVPDRYNLDDVLIYWDDFKIFEKILGIKHEKDTETFQQTLERAVRIMKNIVEKSANSDYAQIFVHKVFAPYLIAAIDILELNAGKVQEIRSELDRRKRLWLRPYFLSPSRFARIGIEKLTDGTYWVKRYHEVNDGGHLKGVPTRLNKNHIKKANKIRESIADWYQSRRISVTVKHDEIPPFSMRDAASESPIEIYSPIEFIDLLEDTKKIPDSYITYNFVGKGRHDILSWVSDSLGDTSLAKLINEKCIKFSKNILPTEIRGTITTALKKHYSSH